jgi:hypothetical protein
MLGGWVFSTRADQRGSYSHRDLQSLDSLDRGCARLFRQLEPFGLRAAPYLARIREGFKPLRVESQPGLNASKFFSDMPWRRPVTFSPLFRMSQFWAALPLTHRNQALVELARCKEIRDRQADQERPKFRHPLLPPNGGASGGNGSCRGRAIACA